MGKTRLFKNVIFTEPQARRRYVLKAYPKVNDCFISWKCFIVIYLKIHRHTNKISQFWCICICFSRKTNVVIEQRKNEFDWIAKVWFSPSLFDNKTFSWNKTIVDFGIGFKNVSSPRLRLGEYYIFSAW
jgi:hypothetical protein